MSFKNYRRKEGGIAEVELLHGGRAWVREWGTPDFQAALLDFAKEHPDENDPDADPTMEGEKLGRRYIAKKYLVSKLEDPDGEVYEGETLDAVIDDPTMWELVNELTNAARVRANFMAVKAEKQLGNSEE